MSNALAIAHVTQALALLLASNVGPEFDEAVKVEPHKPPTEPPDYPTINVFLYQVTPNTSMRNNDLPTRASDGTLVKRPAAALDLHYVISAYGVWWSIPQSFDVSSMSITVGVRRTRWVASARSLPARCGR